MALATNYNSTPLSLSTPIGTPYKTSSRRLSRPSSRHESSSPATSSSPPPLPLVGEDSYFHGKLDKDPDLEEKISILDPRRFTPTLHASLVSEILSLRREVENRNKSIVSLEESLNRAETENIKLSELYTTNVKEKQSMNRQFQLLETNTMSALEGLAKERDDALDTLVDLRRRLDVVQKKNRNLEEEADRANTAWDHERQQWYSAKQNLDRKIHVAEGRLKTILAEVAASQFHDRNGQPTDDDDNDNPKDCDSRPFHSNRESRYTRPESRASNATRDGSESRNGRASNLSGRFGFGCSKVAGISLAEELELDEGGVEEMEENDTDAGFATREELSDVLYGPRPFSAQSHLQSSKARKVLGLAVEEDEKWLGDNSPEVIIYDTIKTTDSLIGQASTTFQYVDRAIQLSPPPSPKLHTGLAYIDVEVQVDRESPSAYRASDDAGYTKPREHDAKWQVFSDKSEQSPVVMISHASQTMDQPPSPPDTPKFSKSLASAIADAAGSTEMKAASTQTIDDDLPVSATQSRARDNVSLSTAVPVIAIHPPIVSSASDQHSVVLPPHTRNAICQVSITMPISSRSVSIQTEEIRVDRRSIKLPPHLLPSTIASIPFSSSTGVLELHNSSSPYASKEITQPSMLSRAPRPEKTLVADKKTMDGATKNDYPGKNDDGVLKYGADSNLKRPVRSSSLFAGFDDDDGNDYDDEKEDHERAGIGETDYSDDDFGTAEPIRKTLSKVQNSWKFVSRSTDSVLDRLESHKQDVQIPELDNLVSDRHHLHRTMNNPQVNKTRKVSQLVNPSKQPNVRRSALVSNGIAAHSQRTKNENVAKVPSTSAGGPAPPFPVPTRNSSKKVPLGSSDGAPSPTPKSTAFTGSRITGQGRQPVSKPALRKVRSDFVPSKPSGGSRRKSRSRSPPPPFLSPSISDSPRLPPLPKNALTSKYSRMTQSSHTRRQSSLAASHSAHTSIETAVQQTSVVDAIAQTMVGEWMWKYVRRRKTFGIPDTPQAEFENGRNGGEGSRHQRWVWLAPYDRAVMWSTKQPTSEAALMGKSGRKREFPSLELTYEYSYKAVIIQSVLDVKDETPLPKAAHMSVPFGRSILILTPQRALKFTAATRERHHVWLAALSFLSSNVGIKELVDLPLVPSHEYQAIHSQHSAAFLRRNPIRDSIRVAKNKARPTLGRGKGHAYSSPNISVRKDNSPVTNTSFEHVEEEAEEAAEPPYVPRMTVHTRKRSNTGPKPVAIHPLSSFRSFSSSGPPRDEYRIGTALSSSSLGNGGSAFGGVGSQSGSGNFFDTVGTVRMAAFVEGKSGHNFVHGNHGDPFAVLEATTPAKPWKFNMGRKGGIIEQERIGSRRGYRKDLRYWGASGESNASESVTAGSEAQGQDLFENF